MRSTKTIKGKYNANVNQWEGQNLKGQILKRVMLKGVDEGVVCLPVHDAIAVQRRHESWAVKTMISTWTEVVGCDVRPRVKVDKAA